MNCPLCNSQKIKEKFLIENVKLYKCETCELEFLEDYEKNRASIYEKDYWVDEKNPTILKCKEKNYDEIIKEIPKGKILDYGGGYGSFVNYLKNKGFEIDLYDPYLSNTKIKKEKYDIITLFDVIEHVPNQIKLIEDLKIKLNENGIIIIITPDTGEISNKILGKKWPHYKYEHVLLYNKKSLEKLSELTKLKIQKIKNIQYNYNIEYIEEYSKKYSVYGMRNLKIPFKKYMNWLYIKNPLNNELLIILKK